MRRRNRQACSISERCKRARFLCVEDRHRVAQSTHRRAATRDWPCITSPSPPPSAASNSGERSPAPDQPLWKIPFRISALAAAVFSTMPAITSIVLLRHVNGYCTSKLWRDEKLAWPADRLIPADCGEGPMHHSPGASGSGSIGECLAQRSLGPDRPKLALRDARRVEGRREGAWRELVEGPHELEDLVHHPVGAANMVDTPVPEDVGGEFGPIRRTVRAFGGRVGSGLGSAAIRVGRHSGSASIADRSTSVCSGVDGRDARTHLRRARAQSRSIYSRAGRSGRGSALQGVRNREWDGAKPSRRFGRRGGSATGQEERAHAAAVEQA